MARKKEVAVFVNENAGKNTSREGYGRVIADILKSIAQAKVFVTHDLDELQRACENISQSRTDVVAFPGGDGTLQKNATALIREHDKFRPHDPYPQIMLLPCGTFNTVAGNLGLTWCPATELAERIGNKIAKNLPFDLVHNHALKVNDQYGFMYGAGLPVNLLQWYYEGRPNLGPVRALKVIGTALLHELLSLTRVRRRKSRLMAPVHASITLPAGGEHPVAPNMTHTAIIAGTVSHIGMGCRGNPLADSLDGFGLRSSRISFWGAVMNILPLWFGLPILSTFDASVMAAEIDYVQPAVRTLDGELEPAGTHDSLALGPMLSFIRG